MENLRQEVKKKKKAQRGFTLIELLVVIAIIAILAAVAIPQYTKYKRKAAASTAASALTTCLTTLGAEYADSGTNSLTCTVGNTTVALQLNADGVLTSVGGQSITAGGNVTISNLGVNNVTVQCVVSLDNNGQVDVVCNPQ